MEESSPNYDKLYKKYEWLIFKVIKKIFRNYDELVDICHEVWIAYYKAIENGKRFKSEEHRKNWLAKVAYYIAMDAYQKKIRFEYVDYNEKLIEKIPTPSVESPMLDLVLELYERLKPNYKETFNLFYFKCLKVSEISKQLNISENAVKKRLERARKTIKEALTRSGY